MSLGSGWWNGDWEENKLIPDINVSQSVISCSAWDSDTRQIRLDDAIDVFHGQSIGGMPYEGTGSQYGQFGFEKISDSSIKHAPLGVTCPHVRNSWNIDTPAIARDSLGREREIIPVSPIVQNGSFDGSAWFYITYKYDANGDSCYLFLEQPPVYTGTPAETISAVIMDIWSNGGDVFFDTDEIIDTATFDNTYDIQQYGTLYYDVFNYPNMIAYIEYGSTVADTIKLMSRHATGYLGIGMDTKIVYRRLYAPVTMSTIYLNESLADITMEYSEDIYNHLQMRWGTAQFVSGWSSNPSCVIPSYIPGSPDFTGELKFDKFLADDIRGVCLKTESNFTSIASYGLRKVPGTDQQVDPGLRYRTGDRRRTPPANVKGGIMQDVSFLHHPYFFDISKNSTYHGKKTERYMDSLTYEDTPRKMFNLKSNLLGLDYDVGTYVDVYMKQYGYDYGLFLCTEKTIDFNNLTVESILLEAAG